MRVLVLVGSLAALALATAGCQSILGIQDHSLASAPDAQGSGDDNGLSDSAAPPDAPSNGDASGSDGGSRVCTFDDDASAGTLDNCLFAP